MANLPPAPAAVPHATFGAFYNDDSKDEYNHDYALLMNSFAIPGQAPAILRDLATNNPQASSIGYLQLSLLANNPAGPGVCHAVHNVAKFRAVLGQPATQWDNRNFGSLGDAVGHQIPSTVELPATIFNQLNNGTNYRVGVPQLMDLVFNDPNVAACGPFGNHDAGTELIQSRNSVPVPHRYMGYFLGPPRTPKEVWFAVGHSLINNGDTETCRPLFDFIRLACTLNAAGDTASPLAQEDYITPTADAPLIRHRTELIQAKLPGLNMTPEIQGAMNIASGLGELVQEQRVARNEAAQRSLDAQVKTPEDYFGPSVLNLIRVCQVATAAQLPPVYQAIAQGGRKKARLTMQLALDETAEQLGYGNLRITLTPDVSSKIDQLQWRNHPRDLSIGLNPFSFGDTNPDIIESKQDLIRQYDLMAQGNAAPSLEDIRTITATNKVSMAHNWTELEASRKMFHTWLHTFLGAEHVVTEEWHRALKKGSNHYATLAYYQPKTARHELLTPAMMQHWDKMQWAYFLDQQWTNNNPEPTPPFCELYKLISTGAPWESPLPEQYLSPAPTFTSPRERAPSSTPSAGTPAPAAIGGGPAPRAPPVNSTVLNPDYKASLFETYKNRGLVVREVIQRAVEAGRPIPKNDRGQDMCITFHVKGFCNMNCGRKLDHGPPKHTAEEDARLVAWCATSYVAAS
jgi:hypothetical protein